MGISRNSWHYKLVKHKYYILHLDNNNQDAVTYIVDVFLGLYIKFFMPIFIVLVFIYLVNPSILMDLSPHYSLIMSLSFIIIIASPLWFMILCILLLEPFITKKFKKLIIFD